VALVALRVSVDRLVVGAAAEQDEGRAVALLLDEVGDDVSPVEVQVRVDVRRVDGGQATLAVFLPGDFLKDVLALTVGGARVEHHADHVGLAVDHRDHYDAVRVPGQQGHAATEGVVVVRSTDHLAALAEGAHVVAQLVAAHAVAVVGVLHPVNAAGCDGLPLGAELDDGGSGLQAVPRELTAPLIGRAVAVLAVQVRGRAVLLLQAKRPDDREPSPRARPPASPGFGRASDPDV
jgi:hypothetical protein